jgi:hypothetical protein
MYSLNLNAKDMEGLGPNAVRIPRLDWIEDTIINLALENSVAIR